MNFWLVLVLLLCVAVLAVLLTMLPTIASKAQLATGAILGALSGTILMKLWKDRKGGELEQQKADTKEAQEDFEQAVQEVLGDIEKEETSVLNERL